MINFLIKTFITLVLFQSSLLSQEINIDKIHLNAKKAHKDTIIYLHRIGCSYCNSMQEFTLEDDDVLEYLQKHYEVIHINVSLKDNVTYKGSQSGGICLAQKIGYDFYPSVLFLDNDSEIEYASVGYKDELEFLVILNYHHNDIHKKMSLKMYKKSIGFKKDLDGQIQDPRKHK